MKKHLTYKDAKSDKFWSIETNDKSYTVTYGKTGTSGTVQTKSFGSDAECMKEAEKLLKEKTKKGYAEEGGEQPAGNVSASSGYLKEWDEIVKAKDLPKALAKHFSYLADSPGYDKVLGTVMGKATSAMVERLYLNLLKINFGNKATISISELSGDDFSKWPKSFASIFARNGTIEEPHHTLTLTNNGRLYAPVAGWEISPENCFSPLNDGSDLWVYHYQEHNSSGEPRLYKIDHASNSPAESVDINIGSLFLKRLAEILNVSVEMNEPLANDLAWWEALPHEWQELLKIAAKIKDEVITHVQLSKIVAVKNIDDLSIKITTLIPIARLTDLTELEISCDFISDLTPLGSLTKLKRLKLVRASSVKDISPLASLQDLTFLDISDTSIDDLEPVRNLKKLETLDITSTLVANVEPLSCLMNLKNLRISHTKIETLAPITSLKKKGKLKEITFNGLSKDLLKTLW